LCVSEGELPPAVGSYADTKTINALTSLRSVEAQPVVSTRAAAGPVEANPGGRLAGKRRNRRPPGSRTRPKASKAMSEWLADAANLKFAVGKSIRYHARRRAFFDALHRFTVIVTLLGGSAAFVAVLQEFPILAQVSALAVAVTSALDLAVGFSSRARTYDDLCRRWADLGSTMERTVDATQQMVHDWKAERLQIEKDEPTQLGALNIICHNEEVQAHAWGTKYRLWFHQRLFCHLCTLPPYTPKAEEAAASRRSELEPYLAPAKPVSQEQPR